jgi:peptidoglycan/xylan/chitin deacetylase (PgdA/CDA1 family)
MAPRVRNSRRIRDVDDSDYDGTPRRGDDERRRFPMSAIPILCYHHVAVAPATSQLNALYVSPAEFERQLWMLRKLGFTGVGIGEGLGAMAQRSIRRIAILTFDDGYTDAATTAAPLLQEYGFRATLYAVSEAIGGHNHWDDRFGTEHTPLMSREQLAAWVEAGMELGSHSCTHPRMNELSDEAALRELTASREQLHAAVGVDIRHFCYPFGGYSDRTAEFARQAGYRSAVTVTQGRARPGGDPFRLPRLFVDGRRGMWRFAVKAATPYTDLRKLKLRN